MKKNTLKYFQIVALVGIVLLVQATFCETSYQEAAQIAGMLSTKYTTDEIQENEKKAIEEFKILLTAPLRQVKKWAEFCQIEIDLLEGNEKYAGLREAIKEVQFEKDQKILLEKLRPHFATLPQEVQDLLNSFTGIWLLQLSYRIKNS